MTDAQNIISQARRAKNRRQARLLRGRLTSLLRRHQLSESLVDSALREFRRQLSSNLPY